MKIFDWYDVSGNDWGDLIPYDGRVKPNAFPKRINFSMSYAVAFPEAPRPETLFPKTHVGYWINYMAEHDVLPKNDPDLYEWVAQEYVSPEAKPAIVDSEEDSCAVLTRTEPGGVYAAIEITDDKTIEVHGWFTQRMLDESKRAGFAGGHYWYPVDELEKENDY